MNKREKIQQDKESVSAKKIIEQPNDNEAVVFSSSSESKLFRHITKKRVLAVLLISISIAVILGAYLYINNRKAVTKVTVSNMTLEQKEDYSDQILNETLSGNTDSAIDLVKSDKAYFNSSAGQEQIARIYYNSDNKEKAIQTLEISEEKYGLSKGGIVLFTNIYESMGNKMKTIEYHQKYILIVEKSKDYPMKLQDLADAKKSIEELKK